MVANFFQQSLPKMGKDHVVWLKILITNKILWTVYFLASQSN